MSYTAFTAASPTTSQTRQAMVDSTRNNLVALRDAIAMGRMPNWNVSIGVYSGTINSPTTVIFSQTGQAAPTAVQYTKSGEELLVLLTASDNPTGVYYHYGTGSSASRVVIGHDTIFYDSLFNVTGMTWTDGS